jgi:CheY-like chemotaxis protein
MHLHENVPNGIALGRTATVLVIDDNPGIRDMVKCTLQTAGIRVCEADNGESAIASAVAQIPDLMLVDFRLPDMTGLDVMTRLRDRGVQPPWILMSGWLTTALTVEAMKRGAIDVVDLPFDVEEIVVERLRNTSAPDVPWPSLPIAAHVGAPGSAAERWVAIVLRACDAPEDPATIQRWAVSVGVSYTTLTETCRIVGIQPQAARDFTRVLRALTHSRGRVGELEWALDVRDERTLRTLRKRAGVHGYRSHQTMTLNEFIAVQAFVPQQHRVLTLLQAAMRHAAR